MPAADSCGDGLEFAMDPGLGMFSLSIFDCDVGILGAIFCVNSRFFGSNGT